MATISGTIVDQRNSMPLEGVAVKADGEGVDKESSTDGRGQFQIDGLAAGQYEIVAQKQGYEPGLYGPLWVIDEAPFELNAALSPERDW